MTAQDLNAQDLAPEVLCDRRGCCGLITLNRPHALNALTHRMVTAIAAALEEWEYLSDVTRVIIRSGGGRAFCAGGDIRRLYDQGRAGDHDGQLRFWADEYRLNLRIKRYAKPIIALVDGIVMGGGVGVSLHGSHVVAGDGFSFAMPEVGIGFFPDVGASWFLPRLAGKTGVRFALTGARAGPRDALALGLVHAHAPSARFEEILQALIDDADVAALLAPFKTSAPFKLDQDFDDCFAEASVIEILARLEALGTPNALADSAAIRRKSPTSLCIALRQMQLGGELTFAAAIAMEFAIVSRVCRSPDFYEGVRALVIDKDNRPVWSPSRLEEVDAASIERFFAPIETNDLFGGRT